MFYKMFKYYCMDLTTKGLVSKIEPKFLPLPHCWYRPYPSGMQISQFVSVVRPIAQIFDKRKICHPETEN